MNEKSFEIKDLKVFTKDAITVIEDTPLFDDGEKQELVAASRNMENSFFNSQVFRTDTEARVSVLNDVKFPTPASKYYQSLREMNVHQCELVNLLFDYEDKKQDIKIAQVEAAELESEYEKLADKDSLEATKLEAQMTKKNIELERQVFALKNMKRAADGRKREIMQWDRILNELEPILEAAKIPTNDPDAHQKVSYAVRFTRQTINALKSNAKMDVAEANNLIGQLTTTMKSISEQGLETAVITHMTMEELHFVASQKLVDVEKLPLKIQSDLKLLDHKS